MIPTPHRVVRQRAVVTEDRYGNQSEDWTSPSELTIAGWMQPTVATGDVDTTTQDMERAGWNFYCRPGADIVADDRLAWSGSTFRVVGIPAPLGGLHGTHHIEVKLQLLEV